MKKNIFALFLIGLTACTTTSQLPEFQTKQEIKLINKMDLVGKKFIIEDEKFNSKITLGFSEDRVYGFTGVNRYFGLYKLIDNKLIIDTIGSTKMAGSNSEIIEEVKFLTLIKDNKKVTLKDNYLILLSNQDIEIKFRDPNILKLD